MPDEQPAATHGQGQADAPELPEPKSERGLSGEPQAPPLPGGEVLDTSRSPVQLPAQTVRLAIQEVVRGGLAFSFVVLLGIVVVFAALKIDSRSWTNAKEYLDVLVPALVGLIGSASGFYFASRQ